MRTQLLWKDWRVFRVAIFGGAILIACPYVSTLLLEYFYPRSVVYSAAGFRTALSTAAMMALAVTVLMSAVFGGIAFAVERRERSAEFLGMLPVDRRSVLLGKLLVTVPCVAAMWLIQVLVLRVLGDENEYWGAVFLFGPVILMSFGVAWMLSTFLNSAGLATAISAGVTIGSSVTVAALANHLVEGYANLARAQVRAEPYVNGSVQAWTIGVGLLCLCVGSFYYLRRIEP